MSKNVVLAITGASGAVYGLRLLDVLVAAGCDVQLSISPSGAAVLQQELAIEPNLDRFEPASLLPPTEAYRTSATYERLRAMLADAPLASHRAAAEKNPLGRIHYHHYRNLMAGMASGSARTNGMVICPCSGSTLSAVAHGTSTNLIHRAADVHLKERRKLILVPRETPLSLIHIDNMRRCTEAGAVVLPASPGFYHGVDSIRSLVDFVVARICDQLGVEHQLTRRWGE